MWYIDSEFSKHMTLNKENFFNFREEMGGNACFGDIESAKIIGKGMVSLGNRKTKENNVLLVENMKHNLLSVSQMCDQGNALAFYSNKCKLRNNDTCRLVATTSRISNNAYILDEKEEKCCMGKIHES